MCASIIWLYLPSLALGFAEPSVPTEMVLSTGKLASSSVTWTAPKASLWAWRQWQGTYPEHSFRGQWDEHTHLVRRVYGTGIFSPGISRNPRKAEEAATRLLEKHLSLWAPGASPQDFLIVSNHFSEGSGLRTVGFAQRVDGLEVLGAQWSVRIKNDRVIMIASDTVAAPSFDPPGRGHSSDIAETLGRSFLKTQGIEEATLVDVAPQPVVLPLRREAGLELAVVQQVKFRSQTPTSAWTIFISTTQPEVLAAEQTLRFFDAHLELQVPDRFPDNGHIDVPARSLQLMLEGQDVTTDTNGSFAWGGANPAFLQTEFQGERVRIQNQAGRNLIFSSSVRDGQVVRAGPVADSELDEFDEAQIAAYYAADVASRFVEGLDPSNVFTRVPVDTRVNFNDTCNAFSDGRSINFFRAGSRCDNTARLLDVVMHEYGHTIHAQSLITGVGRFDTSLSEGLSDFLASTIADDPDMGRGFFYSDRPLRRLDPPDEEARWPEDIASDPHTTGLIYAGALWDLRKRLIKTWGETEGRALTDRLWYEVMLRATDIPSTYLEILAADDDDGDLANGTPNYCDIDAAFGAHGLTESSQVGFGPAKIDGLWVSIAAPSAAIQCPERAVVSADLFWRRRSEPSIGGRVELLRKDSTYSGELPPQPDGEVIEYRILITLASGQTIPFPKNPAAPYYEVYFGPTEAIYCTDFERDPFAEGWQSALLGGEDQEGANDWQWGNPAGTTGSGDPTAAFSGRAVLGNDLGGGTYNGRYQPSKVNAAITPIIATPSYDQVRLQYRRWLTVEDGFYDRGEILADGAVVWANQATSQNGDLHHEDEEWRFHDVDVTEQAKDGTLQISFQLSSDAGLNFGGWTLDDFCIVGAHLQIAECGDGVVQMGEACDDGNLSGGDGCELDCTLSAKIHCGNGVLDGDEMCDDGNLLDGDGCESSCTFTVHPTQPEAPTQLTEDGCGCRQSGQQGKLGAWFCLLALGILSPLRRRLRGA